MWLQYILILCGYLYQGTTSLQLLNVNIPKYKFRMDSALLECKFELERNVQETGHYFGHKQHRQYDSSEQFGEEKESLYSVKWYKDNEEFYRYMPKASPRKHSYRVEGIKVDHDESDENKVMLRQLTLKSSGMYRCEVSAEAPSFASVQSESKMEVVFLPKDGPHISGEERQYQIGDYLNLNCTSGKSHPASVLHWYINDQQVVDSQNLIYYPEVHHTHGLITSALGLSLTVEPKHFHDGIMHVRCVGNLSPVLWQGGRESVVQRRPDLLDGREAMLLVRNSAARIHLKSIPHQLLLWTMALVTARQYMKFVMF